MDPTILIIALVIALPVGVIWALAKAASLRGPMPPAAQRRKSVEMLVTDAIPEEHPEDDEEADERP